MFTGLIEGVCRVTSLSPLGGSGGMRLAVDLGGLADEAKTGDSIAINGVCLTVVRLDGAVACFDLSTETLTKSNLGRLRASSKVNVERALRPSDRLGGHFVQGHIDGTATIKNINRQGRFADIRFDVSPKLLEAMVVKGSVAVDGISLTVSAMDPMSFGVAVIPETLGRTTLGEAAPGDSVNIETDVIVKTVRQYLEKILPESRGLTAEKLEKLGF